MTDNSANLSEQLRNELKSLVDTLEELMHSSTEKSESELEKLKEKAECVIKSSRETLAHSGEKFACQTKDIAQKADHYVHDKPWNGIGIAAAVGVVLGVLLARR